MAFKVKLIGRAKLDLFWSIMILNVLIFYHLSLIELNLAEDKYKLYCCTGAIAVGSTFRNWCLNINILRLSLSLNTKANFKSEF